MVSKYGLYFVIQLNEILAASNLEPAALSVVTRKLEDVLDAKNGAIKDLQVNTTLRSNLMRKLLRNLRYVIADKRYVIIILVRIGSCLQSSQRFATNIRIKTLCLWCSSRRTWFQTTRVNCYWSRNRKRSSRFGCSTNITSADPCILFNPQNSIFYTNKYISISRNYNF